MRTLIVPCLLVVAASVASAQEKTLTRAEYDEKVRPHQEKLKKGQADFADADKRIKTVEGLNGARGHVTTYTTNRQTLASTTKKLAEYKADSKPDEKLIAGAEAIIRKSKERMDEALKLLTDKQPDGAKELVKAVDDKEAAVKAVDDANAEMKKLGARPKK